MRKSNVADTHLVFRAKYWARTFTKIGIRKIRTGTAELSKRLDTKQLIFPIVADNRRSGVLLNAKTNPAAASISLSRSAHNFAI